MLDLRLIRDDPDRLRASQRARGERPDVVDELLTADRARRESLAEFERLRAEQKALGKQIPGVQGDEKQALLDKARHLAAAVKTAEANADGNQEIFDRTALELSNLIEEGVPAGGEDDYVVIREVGERPVLDQPRDHLELGEGLRAIDMVRGAKVSGSRFYFLTGVGAQLELGILNLAMAEAASARFTPVITPTLVRPEIMGGTGFLGAHCRGGVPARGRRPLPGRHQRGAAGRLPRRRDPRPVGRTHPVCRVVDLLPPGGGIARPGHPRDHPGPPVPQGRDVLLLPRGRRRRRAPTATRRGRRRCSPPCSCRTG